MKTIGIIGAMEVEVAILKRKNGRCTNYKKSFHGFL